MDSYLDLIAKKTAAFFAGCAEAGAALAGASPGLREVYRQFGMNMGLVFQMVDDLMDVLGEPEVARKTLRHNLAEGTVTLPMIHAWELDPAFQPLRRLAAGEPLGARAEAALYRRLAMPDVLDRCRETMDEYAEKSIACTTSMPVGIFRHGLVDLLEYVRQCPWGGLAKRLETSA